LGIRVLATINLGLDFKGERITRLGNLGTTMGIPKRMNLKDIKPSKKPRL